MNPLELAIALRGDRPGSATEIRDELSRAEVYCLGQPAGRMSTPQMGNEADLLHFTLDDAGGVERVMLPVFTRPEVMREALARNPDWQTLAVLQVQGQGLLEHVSDDVTIVIDPWSRLEFHLPSTPPAVG
ncbi:MAG: SseB family protein [Candidatus Dormibacteria bacterium]